MSPRKTGRGARGAQLKDVAKAAGVGLATASRALGDGRLVRPSTRAKVERAAKELGYRPVRSARALRGARVRLIGVLVPDISQPVYGSWLRGAGEAAQARDYVLVVCDGQNSMRVMETQLDRLFQERVDGLLLAGSTPAPRQIRRFREDGVPIAPALEGRRSGANLRESMERPATLEAFGRLVTLGHRNMVYLARVERDERYLPTLQRLRIRCLNESLAAVGAKLATGSIAYLDGYDEARARLREILHDRQPTAVIGGSEAFTPAILETLRDDGQVIPGDVSVLTFEDSPWERAHEPPLSVVRHEYFGLAQSLTNDLIDRIEGVEAATLPDFAAEFVERRSYGPARPEGTAP